VLPAADDQPHPAKLDLIKLTLLCLFSLSAAQLLRDRLQELMALGMELN